MANLDIKVREAELVDLELILAFISQKSEFDGVPHLLEATADKLKQTLFVESPLVRVLLAEVAGTAVGFALFYSSSSSLLTRNFFMWYPPRDLSVESIQNRKLKILKPPHLSRASQF